MPYQVELEFAAKTDTGLVRLHNEDSVVVSAEHRFAILADGMGGYNAGEVASRIATSVLKETLEQRLQQQQWDVQLNRTGRIRQLLVESIVHANDSIFEAARNTPEHSGMGTTLVMALFYQEWVTVAHIGDSRAYRLRAGELIQLTRDHSMLQEQIDAGLISEESLQFAQNRNLITRAMGVDHNVNVETHEYRSQPGDIYLLCSDGLSDMVDKQELQDILVRHGNDLAKACDALVSCANDHGGLDNISVILTSVLPINRASSGIIARVLEWLR